MSRFSKPSFSYTAQHSSSGPTRNPRGFRIPLKVLPLFLILFVGLGIGLTRGPSGSVGRAIESRGGTHKNTLRDAFTLISKGEFTTAADAVSTVLRNDPSNTLAWHILGLADARRGLTEEAAICFEKAVELDPGFAMAWFNLGVVNENRGEFGQALTDYRKASDLDKSNGGYAGASKRMERIVMGEGEWDWREKEEGNMFLEGVQAVDQGEPESLQYAENIFRSLAESRPYDVAVKNMLGLTLAREGNLDEAEALFLEVTLSEPGYADAWYNLGMVHRAQGNLEAALDNFQRAKDTSDQESMQVAAGREITEIAELSSVQTSPSGADN